MNYVLPLQDALVDILALEVQNVEAAKLRQGQCIFSSHEETEVVVWILCEGVPQALATIKERRMSPLRVFNIK
jgi:hypothetical protein